MVRLSQEQYDEIMKRRGVKPSATPEKKKKSKYKSKKVTIDNITFDSKDEALYYEYLKRLEAEGKILGFELQPKYILIPSFTKYGKKFRATTYTPDFIIYRENEKPEIIDIKGFSTQQGELRRKLFDSIYPDLKLTWIARSLKHGDPDGWIDYDELQKVRRKNKKEK